MQSALRIHDAAGHSVQHHESISAVLHEAFSLAASIHPSGNNEYGETLVRGLHFLFPQEIAHLGFARSGITDE
jgi:hypothetical protein